MIQSTHVIGRGRAGSAIASRLVERGVPVDASAPDLVLLCVPDRAIAEVASATPTGPWIAHVSGGTPLSALAPHTRRFGLHPLQTFTRARGAEQLDGAYAAVTAERDEARDVAVQLARTLGLQPFLLVDGDRAAYHAGAVMASNYLVTLRRAAGSLLAAAGAPEHALDPLVRAVIENDFALTGPIERGDWETVNRHLGAIRASRPELERAYCALADLTAAQTQGTVPRPTPSPARTIDEVRTALAPRRAGRIGLVPTMGALHEGHLSLLRAARTECDTVVMSLFVNPAQFGEQGALDDYPRDEQRDLALAAAAGVDVVFAPSAEEMYPPGFQTWVEVGELGSTLEGAFRPGHFRGVATVCLKLFSIIRPDLAYFGQKDAQQVEVLRRLVRDLALELQLRVLPTVRDADGLALSSRNARLTPAERERALALPRALATKDVDTARRMLAGLDADYVEIASFDPPVLAAAIRIGSTRLIDNMPLAPASRESARADPQRARPLKAAAARPLSRRPDTREGGT
jgi:pantoate--beta-alanine ligase